jgi:predicted CoA-binding protein
MTTTSTPTPVPIKQAAADFLACRRIAVTGVSRSADGHGGNTVYRRLRDRGYDAIAINPNADTVEGDPCWPDLRSVPGGVEAVVIATRPEHAEATVRECAELGIRHVWMHRSVGGGSVCEEAAVVGREHGLTVIAGGCPLMFAPVTDPAHRVMRWILTATKVVPRGI